MRDKNRKSKDYFKSYIKYQDTRINNKREKLKVCGNDEEKKQRILVSLVNFDIDMLKAKFSFGVSAESLQELLNLAIEDVTSYKNPTNEQILVLLSLSIMLDNNNKDKNNMNSTPGINTLIENKKDLINKNRLLKCLAIYIQNGQVQWDTSVELDEVYEELDEVFSSDNKSKKMFFYLENWYNNHSEFAWHNSHLGDTDTYCGYWSFESAAIAKMLKLDDKEFKQNEYYPVI